MNIISYLYIELNTDKTVTVKAFIARSEAVLYASQRLRETVSAVLGADYVIPEHHIDESGNIWHSAGEVEIYSSGYDWSLWRSGTEEARASVEEQIIELSHSEMLNLYDAQAKEFLVEDAERQLRDYAEYSAVTGGCMDFTGEYGFTVDQAADIDSDHYLLERIVERYSDRYDCGIAENDLWYAAIDSVLKDNQAANSRI